MQPARMAQIRRDPASEVVSVSPRRDFRPTGSWVPFAERRHAHLCLPLDPVCSGMKVLLFDTFGTLVDWRTSLIATLTDFGRKKGRQLPAAEIADGWRAAYEPMMNRVRTGKLPWTDLDTLHRVALTELLPEFQLSDLTAPEIDQLTFAWHQLSPVPRFSCWARPAKTEIYLGATFERQFFVVGRSSKICRSSLGCGFGCRSVQTL